MNELSHKIDHFHDMAEVAVLGEPSLPTQPFRCPSAVTGLPRCAASPGPLDGLPSRCPAG